MQVVEEVHTVMENEHEEVEIVSGSHGKTTKIARDLESTIRASLLDYLKKNADIFA